MCVVVINYFEPRSLQIRHRWLAGLPNLVRSGLLLIPQRPAPYLQFKKGVENGLIETEI
jgi:hypothetical protein